jgi:hypothetical protein
MHSRRYDHDAPERIKMGNHRRKTDIGGIAIHGLIAVRSTSKLECFLIQARDTSQTQTKCCRLTGKSKAVILMG